MGVTSGVARHQRHFVCFFPACAIHALYRQVPVPVRGSGMWPRATARDSQVWLALLVGAVEMTAPLLLWGPGCRTLCHFLSQPSFRMRENELLL